MGNGMNCATTPKTGVAQGDANTPQTGAPPPPPPTGAVGGGGALHLRAVVVSQKRCAQPTARRRNLKGNDGTRPPDHNSPRSDAPISQKELKMTTQHEKETMQAEIKRVQTHLRAALAEIDIEGGSIRYFNAAFMSAAMVLHGEVEGHESIDAAMTKQATRLLAASGKAGRA